MFEKIVKKISELSLMTKLTAVEIAREKAEYPEVPQVYLDFMREVGWGSTGGMMIYSGLIDAKGFFGDLMPASTRVVLFGDNYCGSYFGFDLDDDAQLVEIMVEMWEPEPVVDCFEDIILRYVE